MPSTRGRYHHGDVPNALVTAATGLARDGGPDAIVLREAARRAGVSATAAYRHFTSRDELADAVTAAARDTMSRAVGAQLAAAPDALDASSAVARFRAVGLGYIEFAAAEPGLFATAFPRGRTGPPPTEPDGSTAHMLHTCLNELVEVGVLPADRRPYAELAAWAAVHGVAALLNGPLHGVDQATRDVLVNRSLDMVISGL